MQKLAEKYTRAFLHHFKTHGVAAIERVYDDDPAEYLRIATRLIPKTFHLQHSHSVDFVDILRRAQAAIDAAPVGPDGRRQLEHLASERINGEILEAEVVQPDEQEQKQLSEADQGLALDEAVVQCSEKGE